MKLWFTVIICTGVICGACSSGTKRVAPLQLGPDTFIAIRKSPFGGQATAQRAALEDAQAYCSEQGRRVLIQSTRGYERSVEVVFRCLAEGDPELQRPTYRQTPSVVIENRTAQ